MIYKLLLILAIFLSVTQWDSVAFPPSEETDNPTSNPHPVAIPALNREERSDCPAGSLQMQTQQEPTNNAAMDLLAKACEERLAEDNYQRAVLRVQNRTQDLTDAEAMNLLAQVRQNPQASDRLRAEAGYYQAVLCVQNRTEAITDKDAMNILTSVSQNLQVSSQIRDKAKALLETSFQNAPQTNNKKRKRIQ